MAHRLFLSIPAHTDALDQLGLQRLGHKLKERQAVVGLHREPEVRGADKISFPRHPPHLSSDQTATRRGYVLNHSVGDDIIDGPVPQGNRSGVSLNHESPAILPPGIAP